MRNTCSNCWYGKEGDCELQSSDCATKVFNKEPNPHWWLSVEEGLIRLIRKEVNSGDKS